MEAGAEQRSLLDEPLLPLVFPEAAEYPELQGNGDTTSNRPVWRHADLWTRQFQQWNLVSNALMHIERIEGREVSLDEVRAQRFEELVRLEGWVNRLKRHAMLGSPEHPRDVLRIQVDRALQELHNFDTFGISSLKKKAMLLADDLQTTFATRTLFFDMNQTTGTMDYLSLSHSSARSSEGSTPRPPPPLVRRPSSGQGSSGSSHAQPESRGEGASGLLSGGSSLSGIGELLFTPTRLSTPPGQIAGFGAAAEKKCSPTQQKEQQNPCPVLAEIACINHDTMRLQQEAMREMVAVVARLESNMKAQRARLENVVVPGSQGEALEALKHAFTLCTTSVRQLSPPQ